MRDGEKHGDSHQVLVLFGKKKGHQTGWPKRKNRVLRHRGAAHNPNNTKAVGALIRVKHAVIAPRWQGPTLCAALDECATSLLACYPVIAEKQHGSEKAYFNKVVRAAF